jgi:serine/threonine protein kinase/Flp pilus assembly protein TadD
MTLDSIFARAIEIESDPERAAFLDQACAGDPGLRREAGRLVRDHFLAGNFLDWPAARVGATTEEPPCAEAPGALIGPYKLLEPIGEGGLGTVWMAQQTAPVKRLVAVKLIKAGMDSRQVSARFEAERQALALMDHPNIARVLDGGTTGAGRPYFVMDLVKGVPITRYCDEHHLTPRQRLELFVPVCQAVQHAHQKGIIHRDLKPSNVLVALYDGNPVPKVIDFGVAKATGQQLTEMTLVTGFGAIVGTLEYMSPEQAEINQLDIDTRSDIYALGVLLYELLTGTPPFTRAESEQGGVLEMLRVIREQEPTKPSAKLSTAEGLPTLAASRGTEPARLTKLVRGELDWMVMKALEKDRNRRYDSANGFALDVRRYLADEPVLACPPSAAYRLRKFARRHQSGLAVAGLVLSLLVLLGSVAGWSWRDRAARAAEREGRLERAVERAELLQREGKRREAVEALEAAQRLARDAAPASPLAERIDALQQRLDADKRDEVFVAQFEVIRREVQIETDLETNQTSRFKSYPNLRETLEQYGLVIGVTPPADAVAAIQKRPAAVQTAVVCALDECSHYAPQEDAAVREWLFDVLRQADGDPWRNKVRRAWTQPALADLVKDVDVLQQPPSFLVLAVRSLPYRSRLRLDLARRVQFAYPGDLWANRELGLALHYAERHAEAVRYWTAALGLRPDNPGLLFGRAACLRKAGELDAAVADLERAIALAPRYAAAHACLGGIFRDQKKPEQASKCLRTALDINPRCAPAHICVGVLLSDQTRLEDAIAAYRKAAEFEPTSVSAHSAIGQTCVRLGRWDEAAAAFGRIAGLEPENHERWRVAAYARLAAGDTAGYRLTCRETIERFGQTDDPVIAQRAAMTCSLAPDAVGDFGPVERLARRAITGTEKHPYYRFFVLAKGFTEDRAGRPAEALPWLERSAPRAGGDYWDATTFAALAIAQHRLGRTDQARASVASAKAIVAQKMTDTFGADWLDRLHAEILSREAEKLLSKEGSPAK